VAPGVALLTAGLAALVGTQATVSWAIQRQREIEASGHSHREAVYEELLTHMTEVFTGGSKTSEAEVRSKVALWGSKETLEALADWHRKTYQIMSQSRGSTTPQSRAELWDNYYQVLAAVRRDLNPNSSSHALSKDLMLGMIFGDYPQNGD
jgi:hypothetical protein